MGDLYFDDLEYKTYTDAAILEDVRALIKSGQREGPLLDYKADVSDKDNWPQTAAAFANSFGGLIIFGVEGKKDQPRRLTGFDPKDVEITTKLTSLVLDRIQPRPDFSVRVVTYDQDPTKEVALLRVAEGLHPPYMHSKDQEHRIYVRAGAQRTEADYLQLSSLLEKRGRTEMQSSLSVDDLFGSDSQLHVPDPPRSNRISADFFKFVVTPRNIPAACRLNFEAERQFRKCVYDVLGVQNDAPALRSQDHTIFPIGAGPYLEQRFGLSARGGIGFVSKPSIMTNEGPFFVPWDFCRYLLDFLSISSLFYQRKNRFYGPCQLWVIMNIPQGAKLFPGVPSVKERLQGAALFDPPLNVLNQFASVQIEVATHPILASRMLDYLEAVLTEIARPNGSVLGPDFRASVQVSVDEAIARFVSVQSAQGVNEL